MGNLLTGVHVPLLTALRADGSVDAEATAAHAQRMIAAGVQGLVALGTTGEFADLTAPERAGLVAAVVDAADGTVPVTAGVGATGTAEACEHARAAADAGAQAVLSLPPLYWKLDGDGLLRHYAAVAAATELPVVLYDFPGLSGTPLAPAVVDRIARELPDVIGIKHSGPELRVIQGVLAAVKPHRPAFSVMVGAPDLLLPALLAGADGTIAAIANIETVPLLGLVKAVEESDLEAVRSCAARVRALLVIPALCSPAVLALKIAARLSGSPIEPHVRTAPRAPEDLEAQVAQVLRALG